MATDPRSTQPESTPPAAAVADPPKDQPVSASKQADDASAPRPFPERRPAQTAGDVRLTRAEWKERAGADLGVSPHAIAGALVHHDPAEKISRSDVQRALDEFAVRRGA